MADKLRVAIIGAGEMAQKVHYPSLASFADVEIAALCELNATRRAAVTQQYGITGQYSDYRQMVEETAPDAVYAIGQPHIMYDIWLWCLQQGLNLYVEKPLGLSMHQAAVLADLAEKHGCITQVSFQRRSCPMVVQLHDQCLARGPIIHAVCRFYKCEMLPRYDARDHMMDDGVHAIDTLRWMCGGEISEIHSICKRIKVPDINFISATFQFDSGATGFMINSWSSGRRIFDVEMHAPGICAEAEHEGQGVLYADGDAQGMTYDTREVAGSDELYIYGGFQAKHREFLDCLRTRTLPQSHFGDAFKTMHAADTILAQALLAGQ